METRRIDRVAVARIDHVVVATPDAAGATATFRGHFELAPGAPVAGSPTVQIGDARIAFVTPAAGTPVADILAKSGEGMAEVCMEVASLAAAEDALRKAGIAFTIEAKGSGKAIAVDPGAAHGVRLTLIEGRSG
jgi:catechol 2,3-dioxygenase-like lactoylglutathione lyase family enzyme